VDATYIIHLENNGRLEHILTQLKEFQPTKTVYISFNKGFKNCNKKLIEQISYQDLTDAFLQCFKDANEKGYNNILILEDDFIFNKDIKNPQHMKSICQFITDKDKSGEPFIYYLGCNPIITYPCSSCLSHYKSVKSCSMHSIIYSKKAREMDKLDVSLKHWDSIIESSVKNRYLYHKALCYQTYPDTENKESWGEKDSYIIATGKASIIKFLHLDEKVEPGFTIIYMFSKFIFWLSVLITILFLYWFLKKLFSKRRH